MVNPSLVPGDHDLFVCGNDSSAKATVTDWQSQWFGWKRENVIDLGDITAARGTEMMLPLWIRMMGVMGGPFFNFKGRAGGATVLANGASENSGLHFALRHASI